MIFKNLFKSKKKWLSDKVSERLSAVAELDVVSDKTILHELAFNDIDEKVRRAALEKLNDFSLWWQSYKKDASDSIKKLSEKTLVAAVTGTGNLNLTNEQKHTFVKECNKSNLLEQVVFSLEDDALTIDTLRRIDKEPLFNKAILDSDLSTDVKTQLIAPITNVNQLKKMSKKLSGELLAYVEEKVRQIQIDAEKPIKLEKQVRLVLAQLNALKDKADYQYITEKQANIVAQWQELKGEFNTLSVEIVAELESKFDAIQGSIGRILEPLENAWKKEREAEELALVQKKNYEHILQQLEAIESDVTQAIAEDTHINQESVANAINLLTKSCQEIELVEGDKATLLKRAESLFNRANQVPKIKESIAQAKSLLNELNELAVPEDLASLNQVADQYHSLLKQWRGNQQELGIALPQDIESSYTEINAKWQQVLPELEKQQRQLFSQTRRKLSELEDLIRQGKFHHAFGLHKKMSFWYQDLSEYQKGQLSRKWQKAEEEIANLHELEKSFSNPKKQELLEDIRKLAEQPLPDPSEQAHRVKMLRSNWQTLGHAGDEEEEKLNETFNQFCEQAFSICREHYKQLEDERTANYDAKMLIVSQLQTLSDNLAKQEVSSWKDVESMYVKLTRLFRETGLVDREKVSEVSAKFKQASNKVKQAINQHHKENEQEKRELIDKAKYVAEQDKPVFELVNELKQLQQKWQAVGYAGKNVDQKLWNEFRAINNPVFEQRDDEKKRQQEASNAEFEAYKEKLDAVQATYQSANDIATLRSVISDAEQVIGEAKGLHKSQYEKLKKVSSSLVKEAESQIAQLRSEQEKQIYVDLFAAVEALAQGKAADTASLKPAWQSALNFNNKESRSDVTLMLELTAGIESPVPLKEQRNQIQMNMLSAKMEQGVDYNLQELLETWLSAGMFEQTDIDLLNRVKPIFVH